MLSGVTAEVRDIVVPGECKGRWSDSRSLRLREDHSLPHHRRFHAPTSGQVSVNGFDRPVMAGEVGVAQSYPLFEHRTVLGNLMLGAKKKEKDSRPPATT